MRKRNGYLGFAVVVLTILSVMGMGVRLSWAGDYPGKWYGFYGPEDVIKAYHTPNFSPSKWLNQPVIRSWGYEANNVDEIKDLLPAPFYNMIKHPEIWGGIRINETAFQPRREWGHNADLLDAATAKYKGTASVGPNGYIVNYKAGHPFPGTTNALELALNNNFRQDKGDNFKSLGGTVPTERDGHRRYLTQGMFWFNFVGRVLTHTPSWEPNPQGIERMQSFGTIQPYDMRGTTPLLIRYLDPTKQDDMSIYIPSMRRIRRLSTGQRWDRTGGGSDQTWDGTEVFNGNVTNYTWKYLGRKVMLCPRNVMNQPKQEVKGKPIGGLVDKQYQRVNTYVLEYTPKPQMLAPVSRVVMYLDPDTFNAYYGEFYDNAGRIYWMYCAGYHILECGLQIMQSGFVTDIQRVHLTGQYPAGLEGNETASYMNPAFMTMENLKAVWGGR